MRPSPRRTQWVDSETLLPVVPARLEAEPDHMLRVTLLRIIRRLLRPLRGRGLLRFALLAAAYQRIYWTLAAGEVVVDVHGYRMRVNLGHDDVSKQLFMTGRYEPGVTALVGESLKAGMVFLDVGAHIGYYTLLAARRVGHTGLVHAFEPGPDTFRLLLRNVRDNRLINVIALQRAVSDRIGFAQLELVRDRGRQRLAVGAANHARVVETTTMDPLFRQQSRRLHQDGH